MDSDGYTCSNFKPCFQFAPTTTVNVKRALTKVTRKTFKNKNVFNLRKSESSEIFALRRENTILIGVSLEGQVSSDNVNTTIYTGATICMPSKITSCGSICLSLYSNHIILSSSPSCSSSSNNRNQL